MNRHVVVAVWLLMAFIIGASGVLARLPVPPPAIAVIVTVVLLLVVRQSASARAAVRRFGLRPLVAFHLVRIAAGAYLLVLSARGVLPREFALAAGWGDILVGIGAAFVVAFCLPVRTRAQRMGLLVWNAAGLIDILGVLGNGIRVFVQNPAIAQPFTILPLALLPLFVVPVVIVTHVVLFAWSSPDRPAPKGRA